MSKQTIVREALNADQEKILDRFIKQGYSFVNEMRSGKVRLVVNYPESRRRRNAPRSNWE